ncbi:MAG: HAMP domain-containing histidine kinase [Hydrogenimonas sp.]|nr:HAMP domain-containing histidine kinase [Hydrogenimonas sp.]
MKTSLFNKIAFKFGVSTLVVASVGIGLLAWLSYDQAEDIFKKQSEESVKGYVNDYDAKIKKQIESLKYDLTMLRLSESVEGMLRAMANPYRYDAKSNKVLSQYKKEVANLFVVMAQQNPSYFQIRILNAASGDEIVRVEKKDGSIKIADQSSLQNKMHRDYMQNSIKLPEGEIYLSKITLNREHYTIEMPFRPTIRVSTMVKYKDIGVIIVINADLSELFVFDSLSRYKGFLFYLADEEGYYIYNASDPQKEFGFEFGKEFLIKNDFSNIAPVYENRSSDAMWYDSKSKDFFYSKRIWLSPERYIVALAGGGSTVFKQRSREYIAILMVYVAVAVLFIALFAALFAWKLTRPITHLTSVARTIAQSGGRERVKIEIDTSDEIEELAKSIEKMLDILLKSRQEIESFAQKLEIEVEKKTKDLKRLNESLEKKVQDGIKELRKKDETMIQQTKLAEMGEMLGAIAHQWRQPLNALALNIQMLEDMVLSNELNEKSVDEFIEKNMETIKFMSKTIDDFKNFYRIDKDKRRFDLKMAIEETIALQKPQLEARNVTIKTNLCDGIEVYGYKNEFKQVILNLISNARDAIEQKESKEGEFAGNIVIELKRADNGFAVVKISDNAGGVPKKIKNRIFEPYFTTKEEGKGTGLGLHMSKMIIEQKLDGTLRYVEGEEGAIFEIVLKIYDGAEDE